MKNIFISLLLGFLLLSCESDNTIKNSTNTLPPSVGGVGEILLVIDTNHLNNELGDALKKVFLEPYPGLPQIEMNYKINKIHFPAFGSLFKKAKTVIFVVPFDDGKSKGYIQRMIGDEATTKIIKNGKSMLVKNDVFAHHQQIIFVFGKDSKKVAKNLIEQGSKITAIIDKEENKRLLKKLYKVGERKKLAKKLDDDLGFDLRIPKDYKLVKGTKKCTWLRKALEETDFNIMISARPYTDESQFDSLYIANWGAELASNVDGGDSSSVKIIQDIYPIESKTYPAPYMVENRSLWKLKNNAMGGPFVSQVKVSKDSKEIYYIEGFIVAPGKKKRVLVREIEAIMSTFE